MQSETYKLLLEKQKNGTDNNKSKDEEQKEESTEDTKKNYRTKRTGIIFRKSELKAEGLLSPVNKDESPEMLNKFLGVETNKKRYRETEVKLPSRSMIIASESPKTKGRKTAAGGERPKPRRR